MSARILVNEQLVKCGCGAASGIRSIMKLDMIKKFLIGSQGSTVIEYGVIAGLISLTIIPAGILLSDSLGDYYDTLIEMLK